MAINGPMKTTGTTVQISGREAAIAPATTRSLLHNTGCMLRPKSALWRPSWNETKPTVARLGHADTSRAWYVTLLYSMCFSRIFHCLVWSISARLSLAGPLRLYNSHTVLEDDSTSDFQQSCCLSQVGSLGHLLTCNISFSHLVQAVLSLL